MTNTDGRSALPRTTIASTPHFFPANANALLDSASFNMPVSGLRETTANLAEVVSGLPTSGLKTNESGAADDSGSTDGASCISASHTPSPAPPR
jgi:hypothetical protein